jgi:hypothetical protein
MIRVPLQSFLGFWTFQFIWVFGVSLTVIYVNTEKARNKDMNGVEILGAVLAGERVLPADSAVPQWKSNSPLNTTCSRRLCDCLPC